jgi:hypothetical protein
MRLVVGWLIPWVCFGGAAASAVFAIVVLIRRPWLWLRSAAVLTKAALLIVGGPLFVTPGDGFLDGHLERGCLVALMLIGPFHLGFLVILIGSEVQERQWDAKR